MRGGLQKGPGLVVGVGLLTRAFLKLNGSRNPQGGGRRRLVL